MALLGRVVGLPWSSDRTFRLRRYIMGHSELELHSFDGGDDLIQVRFQSVERVELNRWYQGGIEVSLVNDHPSIALVCTSPHGKFFCIIGPGGEGFVAAGGVRISRMFRDGEELEFLVGIPGPSGLEIQC
ncbi:hypothetical protein [Kutzneria chonburiensis]|uniref:Uncharacterized protein n=1 Tax=Kutzneria chonburiensis TaxID=1483604 RepID=A0ABV6N6E9_9PSEU|nr:hypothetical protein [Kutzneria chonburiensis]